MADDGSAVNSPFTDRRLRPDSLRPITRTMIARMSTFGHQLLRAWVKLMQRRSAVVVLIAALLAGTAGWYVTGHLKINTDTSDMLSRDLPFRQLSREMDAAFPQLSDTIVIVIDSITPDLADQAALRLTEHLRRQPEIFGVVYDLVGDPFFRRHGLLYMELSDLEELSNRLAKSQPFLTTLYQDPSLKGLADMLVLALGEKSGTAGRIAAAPVLRQITAVVEAVAENRFARLSWEQVMQGREDASSLRRILVTQPALDFTTLHPARRAMATLRTLAIELDLTPAYGIQVRLTGSAALAEEELESVEAGIGLANVVSLALVAVLLVVGLQTMRLVVPVLLTLAIGLLGTAALALLMVESLNLISVAFAVLFIGLGVDFGIHFSLRYREGLEHHPGDPMGWAAASVGGPLTLTAAGAAIGFFSFLPTPYQGFAELGLIAGVGMFVALLANLTVLPALLSILPPSIPAVHRHLSRSPRLLTWLVARHARVLTGVAALLVLVSMAALPAARFDLDPLNLKDPSAESVRTLRDLLQDGRRSLQSITILSESPAQAQILAARLSRLPTVATAATLLDYLPQDQEEKLQLIEDMALFLSPLFASRRLPPSSPTAVWQAIAALEEILAVTPDPDARRLGIALERIAPDDPTTLQRLETALLTTLPQRLEILREELQAGPVSISDLPPSLRAREITADGRTRIEIHPKENITDRAALRRFVETVRAVVPRATGAPVSLYESGNAVVESFRFATFATIMVLLFLLAVLLRRLREVALAFAPLVLAALLTNAIAVVVGLPYNFANIIALPLLFGIGIANGIQLVFRERLERDPLALLDTTTPRAVTLSALTTVASFGTLALSTHPGTASMGLLLGIAITVTLAATLFVLPALMVSWPRRDEREE